MVNDGKTDVEDLMQETVTEPSEIASRVSALYSEALCCEPGITRVCFAEEHWMLAMAALNQARYHFRLAQLHKVRESLGGKPIA